MNKATIESIEWHKDQLFKLFEDDDLYKLEGDIYSVKTELNEIIEKAKSKKRVWVKPTATKKGYYREQEVGRKEEEKGPVEGMPAKMDKEDAESFHSIIKDLKDKGYTKKGEFWVKPTGKRRFSFDRSGYTEHEKFGGSWRKRRSRAYAGRTSVPDDPAY